MLPWQSDSSQGHVAGYRNFASSVRTESARHRNHFNEVLMALNLINSRIVHGSKYRDRLALVLGNVYHQLRIADERAHSLVQRPLEFMKRQATCVQAADQWERDISLSIN